MNDPKLLKCENCYSEGKLIYLGSLSAQGDLLMRLTAKHTPASYSCVMSTNFTLMHDCGFTIKVESGIIQTKLSPVMNE